MNSETLWHITVLSNFAKAYDKYTRRYDKAAIEQSTFPNQFFLLREDELDVGIQKARKLSERLGTQGDRLIALRTVVPSRDLQSNTRTGLGRFVQTWLD